jgi:hypothetical protein
MITDSTHSSGDIIAKIISAVFHPLLMPVYGLIIIFSAPTLFGYLPFQVKKILLMIVLTDNIILPLSLLPWLKYRNIISSWVVSERKERIIILLATSFFYSITVYIVMRFHIPVFIKSFIFTAALLSIAITIINFWYKISIHSAGIGAVLALIIILSVRMHTPLTYFIIGAVLSAGLIMTSRLWLNSHKPREVWTGLMLGTFLSGLILSLF